jgi:hypothetical protein
MHAFRPIPSEYCDGACIGVRKQLRGTMAVSRPWRVLVLFFALLVFAATPVWAADHTSCPSCERCTAKDAQGKCAMDKMQCRGMHCAGGILLLQMREVAPAAVASTPDVFFHKEVSFRTANPHPLLLPPISA